MLKSILRGVTGSFCRTIGRTLAYILIALILIILGQFVNVLDVHASNFVIDYDSGNFKYAGWASFYNLPRDNYYVKVNTSLDDTHNYFSSSTLTSVPNSSGIALGLLVDGGFIKDNVYTVGIYVDGGGGNASAYTTNTQRVLVGESADYLYSAELLNTFTTNGVYVSRGNSMVFSDTGSYISYTFRAPITGPYLILSFTTQSTQTAKWWFNSYTYIDHGSKAPSSQEIVDSLNSSFTNINNSINASTNSINNTINNSFSSISNTILDVNRNINSAINNSINTINNSLDNVLYEFNQGLDDVNSSINEVNNSLVDMETSINASLSMVESSINSSIDNMRNEVNDSLNSEDSDTTSGKCGVLCKLKGIFSGIINLPQNIWNLMKTGFENLLSGIKDIFSPPKECAHSKNLFDFNSKFDTIVGNNHIHEFIDNGFKVTYNSTSGGSIGPYVAYRIGSSTDLNGKTYTVSADINGDGGVAFLYRYNTIYELGSDWGTTSTITINKDLKPGYTPSVYLIFKLKTNETIEYKNIMLVEGSTPLPYEEYGKEVCTGGGSIFDWFGNLFKKLFGFFENLLNPDISEAGNEANKFFDDFDHNDYGLSDIITLPLAYINRLTSTSCKPLKFTMPFVNYPVELPCMSKIYHEHFSDIIKIYQTITTGLIAYWVCVNTFKLVKNFKDPNNDEIEVLDL